MLCRSAGEREAQKRNKDIEVQISKDRRKLLGEAQLLLLGAGETGKSTVVKQLKVKSLYKKE